MAPGCMFLFMYVARWVHMCIYLYMNLSRAMHHTTGGRNPVPPALGRPRRLLRAAIKGREAAIAVERGARGGGRQLRA